MPQRGRVPGEVDFEGGYAIPNLAPGEVKVSASIPGSGRQVSEWIVLEVFLTRSQGFAFEVVSATGVPPSQVQAVLLDDAGQRVAVEVEVLDLADGLVGAVLEPFGPGGRPLRLPGCQKPSGQPRSCTAGAAARATTGAPPGRGPLRRLTRG